MHSGFSQACIVGVDVFQIRYLCKVHNPRIRNLGIGYVEPFQTCQRCEYGQVVIEYSRSVERYVRDAGEVLAKDERHQTRRPSVRLERRCVLIVYPPPQPLNFRRSVSFVYLANRSSTSSREQHS